MLIFFLELVKQCYAKEYENLYEMEYFLRKYASQLKKSW